MILYIAEKPSLARAVADVLPKPHQKGEGFIKLGNGDIVSWCIGHLLEQAQPEAYDPLYKKWDIAHLPIVPSQWKLEVKPKTKKQFSVLKKLIKQAKVLVNVGDPDREGQLLIDEVINFCGVSKAKIASTQRCLISDLNPSSVKKSLANLRSNTDFIPLATSALARARADWLYGINMTRLCTVQGQKSGFKGVLSIGRVQTPLLGLVVKRDLEIENFISKPFYELEVNLKTEQGFAFKAKWKPSEACQPYMDEENRVLSRKLVENVASRVKNKTGRIDSFSNKPKKQAPPLPYNLSALQIDAAKLFGLSAKQVLDTCQSLYEKHKLITYPRSDNRYLPADHFNEASQVISAISSVDNNLTNIAGATDTHKKSKAWNDKKVDAHHAIIPTKKKSSTALSATESKLYNLVSRQYLMQFLPSFDYRQIQVNSIIEGGLFIAKRKEVIAEGWKIALLKNPKNKESEKEDNDFSKDKMPTLKIGDSVTCTDACILDKNTTPPKRFNDASLLSAMTGISRYVTDPEIRKILRDTDGIGTEATRAGIIELLFKRSFLTRHGKEIRSTDIGRQLIQTLPECVAAPDMTAQWESQLEGISQRELRYENFMTPMIKTLSGLIGEVGHVRFDGLAGKGSPVKFKRKSSANKSRRRISK
ncbi:DNA topoisomerase III [Agarilytica rhodophyticola]|uniref:DNA topoisomerase III n=1 Tax=Agarilytica rhodophyticola TaxID=1737490 RepID=UPI000B346875|nr:DNA topoisomerase III [Agarilytica rhodophyticola]